MPRMARRLLLGVASLTIALVFTACVSSSGKAVEDEGCDEDPRLLGSWKSYRTSQVGPSWMRMTFDCGCVYRTTVQLMWMRIREEGNYRLADGALVFTRPSGNETRWPYRFEEDTLVVEEHPGEVESYRRTGRRTCEG